MPHPATERLLSLLATFRSLNPEIVSLVEREVLACAVEVPACDFALLLPEAEAIVSAYLDSPVKRAERDILAEYLHYIEQGARRLLGDGEAPASPPTLALMPRQLYSDRRWLQIQRTAATPVDVVHAVDAAQRRNDSVASVIEPLLKILHTVDHAAAVAWELRQCDSGEAPLDPDFARDILRTWQQTPELPGAAIVQALRWSEDEKINRHWPTVAREADALLRARSLRQWLAQTELNNQALRHLSLLRPFNDRRKLSRWYRRGIDHMGISMTFFATQAEQIDASAANGEWRQNALFAELQIIEHLVPPLLMLADLYLCMPSGAVNFAMAVFGFTEKRQHLWLEALDAQSRYLVRRCFLADLKRGRKPTETIHRLCFGDAQYEANIRRELDLLSEDFDSLEQREVVTARLAANYSSYRENSLLAGEIGRRYRQMMRVLHEDNLRRVLRPEQFARLAALEHVLLELSVIAAESRRYLSKRRNLQTDAEEIVAADMEFVRRIRELRAAYIHRILGC